MERTILHIDCDAFYASVELLNYPEYKNKPLAVGGSSKKRHGVVLAKNEIAKNHGVKTGEPLWQARKKSPNLVTVPPNFDLYHKFSKMTKEIYLQYTDKIEAYGLDENWLDVTGSLKLFGSGNKIAKEIQERIADELGITVSIGVSWNKIFSKIGSDLNKPSGLSFITKENYKEKIWSLPAKDLLMVGNVTNNKLNKLGITTIGGIANTNIQVLRSWFGKHGDTLYMYANGLDASPVAYYNEREEAKSIGNSTTTPRNLKNIEDVKIIIYVLAESVARRMRKHKLKGRVISISVKDCDFNQFTRQHKIEYFTNFIDDISKHAIKLFTDNYNWDKGIRSIGVSVSDFESDNVSFQKNLFVNEKEKKKLESLEETVNNIKDKYGGYSLQRGLLLKDEKLSQFNPYEEKGHSMNFKNLDED